MPGKANVGSTATNGLHFLYDRVLNWVRKGEPVPAVQPTPLPRETRTSARRKSMVHGSSGMVLKYKTLYLIKITFKTSGHNSKIMENLF